MAGSPIYTSRLLRLSLLDGEGVAIGRIDDLLVTPCTPSDPPRVLGFVASVQHRPIFLNAGRIATIDGEGVHMRTGNLDLRRFSLREGELLVRRSLLDRQVGGEVVTDLAIVETREPVGWRVASVQLSSAGLLRLRRAGRVVPWSEVTTLFDMGAAGRQVAALREMHPAELAEAIRRMPLERRRQLAEAMDDERLADLLEEMPEDEQVRLIETLDIERAADVLEEMRADDAADLLAEMPADERNQILAAMEPEDANPLRRLLLYEGNTAGGLMTPEPLIVTPQTTVAECLARIRDPEMHPALGAEVFIANPPTETPTGRYLGSVGFQRLLREPPSTHVGDCLDQSLEPVTPDLSELEVARRLAAYDAIAVPVVDAAGRLVGAVTVDDVLDRVRPAGWRAR